MLSVLASLSGELYFYPNGTDPDKAEVVAPLLDSIVAIDGAHEVSFIGFDFTETRATYLSQYEVTRQPQPQPQHRPCDTPPVLLTHP